MLIYQRFTQLIKYILNELSDPITQHIISILFLFYHVIIVVPTLYFKYLIMLNRTTTSHEILKIVAMLTHITYYRMIEENFGIYHRFR